MTVAPDNSPTAAADILYGVAGWSYPDWEGVVYPPGADGQTKLVAVAAACDLLEVNTTFYATPRPATVEAWARRLGRAGLHNRLVVKINRVFTHEEQYVAEDLRALRQAVAPLDADPVVDRHGIEHPRLLGLLLQFPFFFRFTPDNSQRIERLAEDLADWTKIIELRHPSWARPSVFDWLRKHELSLANLDLPGGGAAGPRMKDSRKPSGAEDGPAHADGRAHGKAESKGQGGGFAFPPRVVATGPVGYLRLHGRNSQAWFARGAAVAQKYDYLYRPEELNDLADRIRELAGRTRTVAVIGNNHYRGKALATVLDLAHLVEGRRAGPAGLIAEYPRLAPFTEPAEPLLAPPGPSAKPARGGPDGPIDTKRKPRPARPLPPKDDPNQGKLF